MAGQLSPPPRHQVVSVDRKKVIVIAVARAPALIPCVENGQLTYYLRIGDSTPKMPPYLISDLVLGRREHPMLRLDPLSLGHCGWTNDSAIGFEVEVENEGLVTAEDTVVGVVTWGRLELGPGQPQMVTSALRRYVDAPRRYEKQAQLLHARSEGVRLRPFEKLQRCCIGPFAIPPFPEFSTVQSAVYVSSDGHPPDWYQLDWTVPDKRMKEINGKLTRMFGGTPTVGWSP